MHQPFRREARKLATQEPGDFRLVDFEYVCGASLGESPRSNGFANADRKVGLGEAFFGIGQTNVGENVAAAFFDLNLFLHSCYFF